MASAVSLYCGMQRPTESEINAFQGRLVSPFLPVADAEFSKTRFRLLVAGSICAAIGVFGLHISKAPVVLGLTIENLTDNVFKICLAFVTSYLLLHFLWHARDAFIEWRLRLTGHGHGEQGFTIGQGAASVRNPLPPNEDIRQATLYSFWVSHARYIGTPAETAGKLNALVEQNSADGLTSTHLAELVQTAKLLTQECERVASLLGNVQVPATLQRFDKWFNHLWVSQNIRWVLFDLVLPLLVSVFGLLAISWHWWPRLIRLVSS